MLFLLVEDKIMKDLIEMFGDFITNKYEDSMYITGAAGTGKTTNLQLLTNVCSVKELDFVICAYTHKAVEVLRKKILNTDAHLSTLHSFLSKRPTINMAATNVKHVETNSKSGKTKPVDIIFIDEFSMVGEKDYLDLVDLQRDEEGDIVTKIVYVGDLNQLPPVKDMQTIIPCKPYHYHLTKVWRQEGDNPLLDTLTTLVRYIEGETPKPLEPHETFIKDADIEESYKTSLANKENSILLAYTNQKVQELNSVMQGYENPKQHDTLFSPSNRKLYKFLDYAENPLSIKTFLNRDVELNSKYKTLETIKNIEGVRFVNVEDIEAEQVFTQAIVFGHRNYLDLKTQLANKATDLNKRIETKYKVPAVEWSKQNYKNSLARDRARAWREFLSFTECVSCMDFNHAMTIHKSQGSTFDKVILDMQDLYKCANKDYLTYLKLLYVAISRASKIVITN